MKLLLKTFVALLVLLMLALVGSWFYLDGILIRPSFELDRRLQALASSLLKFH